MWMKHKGRVTEGASEEWEQEPIYDKESVFYYKYNGSPLAYFKVRNE